MIPKLAALFLMAGLAEAHRLDEYLQSTIVSVEKKQVRVQMYLTPGVAVSSLVLARIDTDSDGAVSPAEQRTYSEQVRREVSLTVDGQRLSLRLISANFADVSEMKEGRGDIHLEFVASLSEERPKRTLTFENRHEARLSAYLINCLVPRDPNLRVLAQRRDYTQSSYQLDFAEAPSQSAGWAGGALLLLLAPLALLRRQ